MTVVESQSRVISNQWVNDEYKHMVIRVDAAAANVAPGQFFNLLCPHTEGDKPFFRRPMSTYRADEQRSTVEFLYKVTGAGTRGLATLQANDSLPFLGPLGKGFNVSPDYRHILVVGRGVGLATLAPLAECAAELNIHITALLSARHRDALMSQHRFADAGARVIEVTDNDMSSAVENVERIIRSLHQARPFCAVYTCGSARLGRLLQHLVVELDIDGEIALEQQMACGLGMCYCCVRPMKTHDGGEHKSQRVCYDGPVFPLREVIL